MPHQRNPLLGPTQLVAPQNLTPAPVTREIIKPIVIQQLTAPSPLDILVGLDARQAAKHAYPLLSPARRFNPRVYESIQPILDVNSFPVIYGRSNRSLSAAVGASNVFDPISDIIANLQIGTPQTNAIRPRIFNRVLVERIRVVTSVNTQMFELAIDGYDMPIGDQAVNVTRDYLGINGWVAGGDTMASGLGAATLPVINKGIQYRFSNAGAGAQNQTVDYFIFVEVPAEEMQRIIDAVVMS